MHSAYCLYYSRVHHPWRRQKFSQRFIHCVVLYLLREEFLDNVRFVFNSLMPLGSFLPCRHSTVGPRWANAAVWYDSRPHQRHKNVSPTAFIKSGSNYRMSDLLNQTTHTLAEILCDLLFTINMIYLTSILWTTPPLLFGAFQRRKKKKQKKNPLAWEFDQSVPVPPDKLCCSALCWTKTLCAPVTYSQHVFSPPGRCLHPDWSKIICTCVSFTQFFFFKSTKCFKDVAELQLKIILQLLLSAASHTVGPEAAPVEACCYGNQYTNRKCTPNNKGSANCF